jgi:hypothetical protein
MSEEQDNGQQAPEYQFTKDEYTSMLQNKIGEAVAPKLKKIEAQDAQIAELLEFKTQVEASQAQASQQSQSAESQWAAERDKLNQQMQARQAEIEKYQGEAAAIKGRWHDTHRNQYLSNLALQAGAAPSAIEHIPLLFPRDQVTITETDSGLEASIQHPETGLPVDAKEAMAAWLGNNPHLMGAPPSGSGSRGAGAGRRSGRKDPLAGKHGAAGIKEALKQQMKKGEF